MILEVQIQSFGACLCTHVSARASKFLFLKISRGLKYQYFFVKIGFKLPFTIKKKRKNTNLKFELKNYFILTFEKARFWFLKKNTHKKFVFQFRLWFIFKNNKHTIVICSVFLKTHQKKVKKQPKSPFWPFLKIITFFMHFNKYWPN